MEIKFSELSKFHDKQIQAVKALDLYKYILYGGAKFGGKSYWIRWTCIRQLLKWAGQGHTGVRVAIFCEDYPSLKDRQLTKIKTEFPEWLGTLSNNNIEGLSYRLRDEFGGGVIMFRNLDDPSKYASSEFAMAAVDELTKNKEEVFSQLRSIIRWPGIEDTKFIAGTNPGGIGHDWVRRKWIDADDENETEQHLFHFVQAKAYDNPNVTESYIRQLENLPEALRMAYLEGSWDAFEGQFFSEFRQSIHAVEHFDPPKHWKRYIGIDYGRKKSFVALWFAVDPDNGHVYAYKEYQKEDTDADINFANVALMNDGEYIEQVILDAACFATTRNASFNKGMGDTIADIAWKYELQAIPSAKNRMAGWGFMHMYLRWQQRDQTGGMNMITPKMTFSKVCDYSIKTIPSLIYDKNKPEDLDTDGEDHAADAISYFLQFLNKEKDADEPPKEEKKVEMHGSIAQRLHSIVNSESVYIEDSSLDKAFL